MRKMLHCVLHHGTNILTLRMAIILSCMMQPIFHFLIQAQVIWIKQCTTDITMSLVPKLVLLFRQPCCWIFGLPLVTGHSDDDHLIEDTMILQLQKEFSENDSTSDKPFLNVFDKGYYQLLPALRHGQLCCWPNVADDGFGGDKVLRMGCAAVVRSGNEQAVNQCKMSWFIKRGYSKQLWDVGMLCDM